MYWLINKAKIKRLNRNIADLKTVRKEIKKAYVNINQNGKVSYKDIYFLI